MWSARERRRPRAGARWGGVLLAWLAGHAAFAQAAELRDPFVFGPHDESAQGGAPGDGPGLTGIILWESASPMAIIGGELFTVGQAIDGWRIVEIKPDRLVIQLGDRRETIFLGETLPGE